MQAGNVIGTGIYKPDYMPPDPATGSSPNVTPFWMVGGAGAEVEVDTETGHVRITQAVNVADCGKADQPEDRRDADLRRRADAARLHACSRRCIIDGGQVTNASLADYKIPGFLDVPAAWRTSRSSATSRTGRSAPRAWARVATFCVSPAIANAIDDAVGVRLTELPLNAEAVFRALRAKAGKPLEDE